MEYNTAFYHLGAFLVYIVLWLICSSDIPQFFINANETVSLVSFLSLSIMGIHFAAYTRIILQEGEKWFRFLSYIGWIDPLIILTGFVANLWDPAEVLILNHLYIGMVAVFAFVFVIKKKEKELAEHNMLVDLGRNDVGKISRPGSVKVDKYMEIQRFSHVMHIGSTVTGTISEEKDALDVVDAILPAGTLSGAPKIRACEIIAELEKEKRGIYGGAVGYLDFAGNVDTCISIRLAYKKNGSVRVQSGAGIVADSIPENEFQECLNKAGAVLQAIKIAEGGLG